MLVPAGREADKAERWEREALEGLSRRVYRAYRALPGAPEDRVEPELARRSGLSLSTLRSARKRGSRICLENLKRICDAFGMSLGEFVDGL